MQRVKDFNDNEIITPEELIRQAEDKIVALKSRGSYYILSRVSEDTYEGEGLKIAWENLKTKSFACGTFGSYRQAIEYIGDNNFFDTSYSDLQIFSDWEDLLLNMEIER